MVLKPSVLRAIGRSGLFSSLVFPTSPSLAPPPSPPTVRRRLGVRRPIGSDSRRRRYWALGGVAGCWRVYVEWDEGRRWGWYEGAEAVRSLIGWLEDGSGMERERSLLRALAGCPLGPAGGRLTPEQLQRLRPDAYTGDGGVARAAVVAPLLRGEGGRAAQAQGQWRGKAPTAAQRIQACCEALLGEVDSWFEGEPAPPSASLSTWPPKGTLWRVTRALEAFRVRLQSIQKATWRNGRLELQRLPLLFFQAYPTTESARDCILEVESVLTASGRMSPEWSFGIKEGRGLRQAWLDELGGKSHMSNLALLMVPFQRHVVAAPGSLVRQVSPNPRPPFIRLSHFWYPSVPSSSLPFPPQAFIREVREARCQLSFPSVADPLSATKDEAALSAAGRTYVVMRTALLAHLAKYARLSGVCDVTDLQAVWRKANSLPHAKRYILVATAYRRCVVSAL